LAVFVGYLAWEGRGRAIRTITPWWSWVLSIGPLATWAAVAIALAPPGFVEAAFGDNVVGRFFAGTSHARPFYYYLYQLPFNFLPWSLILPFGLPLAWRAARPGTPRPQTETISRSSARFLIMWIAIPFLFFTASAGKRGVYLLPIFPALALVSALVAKRPPRTRTSLERPAWTSAQRFVAAIAAVALIELTLVLVAFPRLDVEKSPRPIAIAAAAHSSEDERVGVYGMSPIEGALAYYGGRRVASLRREEDLRGFLESGGRLVLLRERDLIALGTTYGLEQIEGFRTGRRRLALAIPTTGSSP